MDNGDDLRSILPFLPLTLSSSSSSLSWPAAVLEALRSLASGPSTSRVDSGEVLFLAISDLRDSISRDHYHPLAASAADGYSLFFDEFLTREEAGRWFGVVVPEMARLLLRLPEVLERHYRDADGTGLRLLESQGPGMVIMSQELIGALLSCSFFCLFPTAKRSGRHLPMINFDQLFSSLYERYNASQENKIKCLVHYFERIFSCMPSGYVSFERKVLPLEQNAVPVTYPSIDFWGQSTIPLCHFEVCRSGFIEDHCKESLEVDFANKYLGGGALHMGCVQEEIRFMINPELIAGMLFLPSMSDNEAIEIIGAERYASTFRFSGDYVDKRGMDSLGRRKTRIIAIDALCWPGSRQYELNCLLREVNKAFCGFLDYSKYKHRPTLVQDNKQSRVRLADNGEGDNSVPADQLMLNGEAVIPTGSKEVEMYDAQIDDLQRTKNLQDDEGDVGVATGNWGCGAFGGDPELKSIIQWLAASQALRPFISYYTFQLESLRNLDQVTEWILSHNWTVGDLWSLLVKYSSKQSHGETGLCFFSWLLPSLS
ncbi:Poly(ADP-ribose) glycohydrolase 1-like protein [Drosera capensis]